MSVVVELALAAFRIIAAIMFAAAFMTFSLSLLVFVLIGRADMDQRLPAVGMAVGLVFGMGGIKLWSMMPGPAALTRPIRNQEDRPIRGLAALNLAALGVAAVLLVPSVLAWAAERYAFLPDLIGHRRDPTGFDIVFVAMLLAAPALAGLAIVSFAVASILSLVAPSRLVPRVLTVCAIQQGCLIGGLFVVEQGFQIIRGAVQQFIGAAPDPAASAAAADWLTRYAATVGKFDVWLVALFAGYLAVRAMASSVVRSRASAPDADVSAFDPAAAGSAVPEPVADVIPVEARPTSPALSAAPLPAVSFGPEEFAHSTYSVRPRQTWLGLFGFRPTDYDITTIPALSRARFSFSWNTGVLRREPDGPDLVAVRASGGALALGRRTYSVADARTGAPIGTLLPKSSAWEIQDAVGAHVADVVASEEGAGRSRYVVLADGRELCKFLWGFTGLTAASAELQVDFLPVAEGRLSRALILAISPVFERQANRASQWSSS